MDKRLPPIILYGLPLLLAAALKCLIWSPIVTPFNADEAIVALMARHINQGHLPVFFYGQYYMGSLDAIFISLGFRLFGEGVWVIRLVQSLLYLGTVASTVALASRVLNHPRAALYAGLLTAVPTVNVALYSTVSLGGYGEMLLIGNLLLLGGIGTIEELQNDQDLPRRFYWGLAAWGLGAGFAFWVLGLSLVYTIPILICIVWYLYKHHKQSLSRGLVYIIVGGILGSAPWWGAAILDGDWAVISELAGGAIAGADGGSAILKPFKRLLSLIVFGGSVVAGIRPPWTFEWLMFPLIPFILIFWMAALFYSVRRLIKKELGGNQVILALIGPILAAGFILTPYGDDPSGRYFLPLLIPMSIFGAELISTKLDGKRLWEVGLAAFLIFFNIGGILQSIKANPPGLTTQFDPVAQVDHSRMDELIDFLKENDIRTGYSNYWVSYPLAFLSQEEIIFIPRLPYHEDFRYTSRDDRYSPYNEIVNASSQVAYITTRHPELNERLEEEFAKMDISWKLEQIGDYTVYYQLSAPVYIDEIGLGVTTYP